MSPPPPPGPSPEFINAVSSYHALRTRNTFKVFLFFRMPFRSENFCKLYDVTAALWSLKFTNIRWTVETASFENTFLRRFAMSPYTCCEMFNVSVSDFFYRWQNFTFTRCSSKAISVFDQREGIYFPQTLHSLLTYTLITFNFTPASTPRANNSPLFQCWLVISKWSTKFLFLVVYLYI